MAALSAAAIQVTERPVTARLTALVERRRRGLVKRLALPAPLEVAAAVVLLDYTLYVWHVLTHIVPFLWRFHEVHHADRDLSASTALRFHFGEMVLSVPWRAAQIVVVGATVRLHVPQDGLEIGSPTVPTRGDRRPGVRPTTLLP